MDHYNRLKDRVAIVTGGGRGIGRSVAFAYAREGARVALAARSGEEIQKGKAEIEALGCQALSIQADVSNEGDVERMVQEVLSRWGRVDILFNAAGLRAVYPSQDLTLEHWQQVVDANLTGSFLCSKAVFPVMIRSVPLVAGCRVAIRLSHSGPANNSPQRHEEFEGH